LSVLLSFAAPTEMLPAFAVFIELIPAVFARGSVPHKDCDDWRGGPHVPFAAIRPDDGFLFFGEGQRVQRLHDASSPNPTLKRLAQN